MLAGFMLECLHLMNYDLTGGGTVCPCWQFSFPDDHLSVLVSGTTVARVAFFICI